MTVSVLCLCVRAWVCVCVCVCTGIYVCVWIKKKDRGKKCGIVHVVGRWQTVCP